MRTIVKNLGSDIPASIVVFLVAVPLCLGVALGSNAPLFSGLIAGIAGGIVVGFFSKSPLSVSGPAAGLISTVALILEKSKDGTTFLNIPALEAFFLAIVIAGVLQFVFGLLKAGVIADFVPVSVLKGMLTAIGLLLILKQFPHLVGYDTDIEGDEAFFQKDGNNTFSEIEKALMNFTPLATLIGLLGLAIQMFWDSKKFPFPKFRHLLPAPLVVVLLGMGLNYLSHQYYPGYGIEPEHMVKISTGHTKESMAALFNFPDLKYLGNLQVWIAAITIAIICSLESLLSVQAVDKLDPERRVTPPNRELKAQGLGNIVSGLFGGLPVTSVIVRSSANVNAGAKSKTSAMLHGFIMAASVFIFPQILNMIPLCALASVLIYTGFKLAKPAIFIDNYKAGRMVFVPFIITVLAILFSDLLIGISIGILIGVYYVIKSNFKEAIRVVNENNIYLVKFTHQVSFLNKSLLIGILNNVPDGAAVTIDVSKCNFMDHDIKEILNDYNTHSRHSGIDLNFRFLNEAQQSKFNILPA